MKKSWHVYHLSKLKKMMLKLTRRNRRYTYPVPHMRPKIIEGFAC